MPNLKRLPIPPLQDTLNRYLARVEPLQDERQNRHTRRTVLSAENLDALNTLHERLLEYDARLAESNPESSYIEQFWYDAYLLYDATVVLNVNPYFQLQDDPTIKDTPETAAEGPYGAHTVQVRRAARLTISILKFIRQIRHGTLRTDTVRGKTPLSMDQYERLFGSSRIPPGPGEPSCHLQTDATSHHVVAMYRGQFYWFDVLDTRNEPIFATPEQLEWDLYSIIMDAESAGSGSAPFGVFTTESRRVWSNIRDYLFHAEDCTNWRNLKLIDSALFVVCLDDVAFAADQQDELTRSMLCGTSNINLDPRQHQPPLNVQTGTCLNRWYDKLQLIVTKNGKAGINFEHTGVDGHTVLRLATDIYTDSILSFARGVTKNVVDIFSDDGKPSSSSLASAAHSANLITIPRKLEWRTDNFLQSSLHFAETRISDLISQYEFVNLDFSNYGASHIKTVFKCSPDAFVQQVFQVAYFALYGRFETVYEPAMTKAFQNGRTEAIRSVTGQSKLFVKSLLDQDASDATKIQLLHDACTAHSQITRECSQGLGQDRHLYALYCLWNQWYKDKLELPPIFRDKSWTTMQNNVLSTSNCGNPCLKSFGFGPVTANGFGIGYIIRDHSVSVVVSSRHRQTARFASLMEKSLLEIDRIFKRQQARAAKPAARATASANTKSEDMKYLLSGYDYFDVSVSG
ncbi:AEG_G0000880.mRNA.1.CDS.1 [Saccharomyces cerevisiae]|nr:AEH_G0000820.mRNA.1.CDS.1 [Saccharomyces cerevisiae]CAI4244835.1 AEG_G0000880.mRNA.1.CDS.1 [Saccharomyces cerevisiae]CAI6472967.1 AEH_G0000820.mRNA.1.CDS.1 [Saccharomyces cerevisiae]CAI6473699.1 AEG_G0000880.mRNA.1.CDS.1 [Saccharomyces cerevisiae]